MRIERRNQELWLQGLYIYEALCDVSPVLHSMAKKGTKAHPYTEKPYPITEKQRRKEKEQRERNIALKGKRMMEMYMRETNKQFEEVSQPI